VGAIKRFRRLKVKRFLAFYRRLVMNCSFS